MSRYLDHVRHCNIVGEIPIARTAALIARGWWSQRLLDLRGAGAFAAQAFQGGLLAIMEFRGEEGIRKDVLHTGTEVRPKQVAGCMLHIIAVEFQEAGHV